MCEFGWKLDFAILLLQQAIIFKYIYEFLYHYCRAQITVMHFDYVSNFRLLPNIILPWY